MRPKLKAVVMPDCDKSMKSCDKCENFDAARRTQSCQAHERYSDAEVIAALTDALKELGVDVPQWMPIESAPKDGTPVLGFWMSTKDIHQIMPICYDDSTGWYAVDFFSSSDGGPKVYPTHWTPLLPKPKE